MILWLSNMATLYIPKSAFDKENFLAYYGQLPRGIVTDQSSKMKHASPVNSITVKTPALQHNRYVQQKYFGKSITQGSKPMFIWKETGDVHISRFGGFEEVKKLKLNTKRIIRTDEELKAIFYIIEYSFWTDDSVQAISDWLTKYGDKLLSLRRRLIYLPVNNYIDRFVQTHEFMDTFLAFKVNTSAFNESYYICIWNGTDEQVYDNLLSLYESDNVSAQNERLNTLIIKSIEEILGQLEKKFFNASEQKMTSPENLTITDVISADIPLNIPSTENTQNHLLVSVHAPPKFQRPYDYTKLGINIIKRFGTTHAIGIARAIMANANRNV